MKIYAIFLNKKTLYKCSVSEKGVLLMTVLPGSLDYLYHNRILDHIPYEAYQTVPMAQVGVMQMPNMLNSMDIGMGEDPMSQGCGYNQVLVENNPHYQVDTFSQNNRKADSKAVEKFINTPWVKGALAGGIMLLTLCCLFKSRKKLPKTVSEKPVQDAKTNLWEKLKGMFKKK